MLHFINMSYPQLLHAYRLTDDFAVFTVPNEEVVEKITRDFVQDTDLRVQVAARSLSRRISDLAFLFSTYDAEIISSCGCNALKIKLFTESISVARKARIRDRKNIMITPTYVRIDRANGKDLNLKPEPQLASIEEEDFDYLGNIIE
jgi:hypothetical protein